MKMLCSVWCALCELHLSLLHIFCLIVVSVCLGEVSALKCIDVKLGNASILRDLGTSTPA